MIDELLANSNYGRHFGIIWSDTIVKRDEMNRNLPTASFKSWLADGFNDNRPWDKTVREMITAEGNSAPATFLLAHQDMNRFAPQKMVDTGDFQLASLAGRFVQDNRTTQSIVITAAASTRWLLSEEMRRSLSVKDGFDMARLKGTKPVSVFVVLDADKLSTLAAFPKLVAAEHENGSVIKGLLFSKKKSAPAPRGRC